MSFSTSLHFPISNYVAFSGSQLISSRTGAGGMAELFDQAPLLSRAPAPGTSLIPSGGSTGYPGLHAGLDQALEVLGVSAELCLVARAEPGSLMPFLEHSVRLLWLFARRSLTFPFPSSQHAQGLGLVCSVPLPGWHNHCFFLPWSQAHTYFDADTVLSSFSCFGAHPASHQNSAVEL